MTEIENVRHMPTGLSPSSIDLWHQCPRRFEKEKVDRRSGGTGIEAVAGTNVHRGLELLLQLPPDERTQEAAYECIRKAIPETLEGGEFKSLSLEPDDVVKFKRAAIASMRTYFIVENPAEVKVVATERRLDANLGGVPFRGIIDRLDHDSDGNYVVTDYKNGKVPAPMFREPKLRQLNFYGALVEAVDGKRPVYGRLLFTAHAKVIGTRITVSSVNSVIEDAQKVWADLNTAYKTEHFEPKTGPLCGWCPFASECPEGMADLRDRRLRGKLKKTAPNFDLAAALEE